MQSNSQDKARRSVDQKNVRYEIDPRQSTGLLQELHLLTRDGQLNADALRKIKQVNHLIGLLTPAVDDVRKRFGSPTFVDFGAGNAYLGFVFYELFLKNENQGNFICVESREDLVKRAVERAAKLGFSRFQVQHANIQNAKLPERVNVVMALHACDTATDDVIVEAIKHNSDYVAVVPCCQAELANQLKEKRAEIAPEFETLIHHPWHRREFGSHLTNVIRAQTLEAFGFQVTVTELTGWEHSLKNELILARRVHRESKDAKERLKTLLSNWHVEPTLIARLRKSELFS